MNELALKIAEQYNLGPKQENSFYELIRALEDSIKNGHQTMIYTGLLIRQLDTNNLVVKAFIHYLTQRYMEALSKVQN